MSLLTKTLIVGVSAVFLVACTSGGGDAVKAKPQFSLPAPTGQYLLGTEELHLVDENPRQAARIRADRSLVPTAI